SFKSMNSFSVTRKKTPFQKHREEEEAKKKATFFISLSSYISIREEDETARLYAEFIESFQGDNAAKTFVRGGTINHGAKPKESKGGNSKDGVSVPKKGSRYVPSFIPPFLAPKGKGIEKKKEDKPKDKEKGKSRNIDNFLEELKLEQERRERRNQEREGRHNENSMSLSLFDELPDDFDPSGKFPGSFDDVDPQTTNLYVGNLSPQVDENFLMRTFGRFGPIASVKIMWPRTEEEKRRQRNCGFVSFMNRADGQAAKDEMQGIIVYDYELKIGWGKSVSLPGQALPAPPPGHMAIRSKDVGFSKPSAAILKFIELDLQGGTVILSGPNGPPVTSVTNKSAELVLTPNIPDIMVVPPENYRLRHVIDTMALHVLDGGCAFEQAVMERGRGNQLFNFLFELGTNEHSYYVWRLYSFAQGDTLQRWRTEPFIMITGSGRFADAIEDEVVGEKMEKKRQVLSKVQEFEDRSSQKFSKFLGPREEVTQGFRQKSCGSFRKQKQWVSTLSRGYSSSESARGTTAAGLALNKWIPPALTLTKSPEHEKEPATTFAAGRIKRVELERSLTDPQRDEFEDMLRALTLERNQIKGAMGFALDNADAAGEIVEVLTESLTLKETPVPTKVARLMLVSDILHNSSAPIKNASAFRTKFEGTLPDIMESFNDLYRSITGRITAEALKERVLKVLQVWADRFLFSDAYVNGLRATFIRLGNSGVAPFHSLCGDAPEIKNKTSSRDTFEVGKINQDAALAMGKGAAMRELLNLPLVELERRCRHNGLSLVGGKKIMVARLLGLEETDLGKVSGLNDDIKTGTYDSVSGRYLKADENLKPNDSGRGDSKFGIEVSSSFPIPRSELKTLMEFEKMGPSLPVSKWAREDDGSDDGDKRNVPGLGLSYSSGSDDSSKADKIEAETDMNMNEEQRQMLRRMEVALIEYREYLEEQGIKSPDEIEKKVAIHRRRLKSEFGLSDSNKDVSGNKRSSVERKAKQDDSHEPTRKRHRSHSRSRSPRRKSSSGDREYGADRGRDKNHNKDGTHELESQRRRERDNYDKARDRDRDERRKR
ncbi:hypothetical protein GIB67_016853, partial [Kingdonia uniflora]